MTGSETTTEQANITGGMALLSSRMLYFFSLKDTVPQWFDNYEDEINYWDAFKTMFEGTFGKLEQGKQQ